MAGKYKYWNGPKWKVQISLQRAVMNQWTVLEWNGGIEYWNDPYSLWKMQLIGSEGL